MRIKILAHQKGEIHHFFKPKFAAFYHWKMPHIWTLFRPAAPPAPKRGENILKGIRGPDTPPVSPSAWPAQPAGLNGRGADFPPLSRSPRDLPCGRSRGPYCASAHAAACPPGALLRQRQGRDACAPRPCRCLPAYGGFFLDGYKGASARPTSAPGGLEALIPQQRPKTRQRRRLPMYSSIGRQAVPMDQRERWLASAGVEAKLVAEERLEYHAGGKIK